MLCFCVSYNICYSMFVYIRFKTQKLILEKLISSIEYYITEDSMPFNIEKYFSF